MTWDQLDWTALERLRRGFLSGAAPTGPYWTSREELAGYDLTYGERIGWKWDAVLAEVRARGWAPAGGTVLDWGCGSGTAGRRVLRAFGADRFDSLVVWDHSPLASAYAAEAASAEFPSLRTSVAIPGFLRSDEPLGLLVASHVLNELDTESLAGLRALARRSAAVLWVEPGTRETSRRLGEVRDELLDSFGVVAPCTHRLRCPVLAPGAERHWCHHFAAPPPSIFTDSNWMKFGRRAGIDLRSLPYSFIAMDRSWAADSSAGLSRVVGRPEHLKGFVRLLNCDSTGLAELRLQKRDDPALYKELERTRRPLVYRWRRDGTKIVGSGECPGTC